jgi:glycosyltransferase involved in cell wall biosynthesis
MDKKLKISVVIPTKNEEATIREMIERSKPYADEILVIDGHSRDRTREFASEAGARVILDHKKGKGDGLRTAIKEVTGDIIVFIDADCSHDPADIPRLAKPIIEGRAEHVTGSRMLGGSDELHGDIGQFIRMVGTDIITMGINYRFNVRLTDSQNGFRAILTEVARKLPLKENVTSIEQELIIKTLRHGYRITEVPAHEYKRKDGKSTINMYIAWFRHVYSWLKYLFMD